MAKIIKKYISADAIDQTKIKLDNNGAIRARNVGDTADIDMIKINASDDVALGADLDMGAFNIITSGTVDGRDVSADGAALDSHLDGGVSKHDASEVDYERLDGSKKNIQAASDDAEAAISDLDDAIGSLAATPSNYTPGDATIVASHLAAIDSALGTANSDENVKVSANDTTAKYLEDAIVSANSILSIATLNDGADEDLQLTINQGNIDHGSIAGLADDDHTQYHNDARGDARYRTQSELSSTANAQGASLIGIEDAALQFTSTNVEGALAEAIDAAQAAQADADANTSDIADIRTTQGVADGATNLGTFTGSTISDNGSVKAGMQELETAVELRALDSAVIKKDGSVAFTADQSMGSNKLTNVANGTLASDAVNKGQLDAAVAGLSWKNPVRVASAANLASLTAITASDFDGTGQGITLVSGDRVLLKDQTTGSQNGIYEYDGADLVRASDMDASAECEGAAVFVQEGTHADEGYTQTADNVTLNTTALTFVQFNGAASIIAGDGLAKSGNTLSVNVDDSSIEIATDILRVKALGITNAMLLGSIEDSKLNQITTADKVAGSAVQLAASGGIENNSGLQVNVDATNSTTKLNGNGEVEALKPSAESITLVAQDITNGYIDLAQAIHSAACLSVHPQGGPRQTITSDYTVALTGGAGGVTRVTFAGDLAAEAAAGDVISFEYSYL